MNEEMRKEFEGKVNAISSLMGTKKDAASNYYNEEADTYDGDIPLSITAIERLKQKSVAYFIAE